MTGLKEMLAKELARMEQIKQKAEKGLLNVPEGTLRIGKSQGCVQYYQRTDETSHNGKYIPKKQMELIHGLAQKSYDEKILKCTRKRVSQISKILKDYEDNEIEQIYLNEHPERQKLINIVEPTWKQQQENWLEQSFKGKGFKDDAPVILTEKGMRVRSKSEKILADYFDRMGIVYKYECPLYLEPYGYIYPDFTFLSPKNGQEIYWEHEGMMDQADYAKFAVKKIELYETNRIHIGERLILTFETANCVINTNIIKAYVDRYLI